MFKPVRRTCYDEVLPLPKLTEVTDKVLFPIQRAGPAPRVHYAEDGPLTDACPQLQDQALTTNALRVSFKVADPSGQYEIGDPVVWTNKLVLRNRLTENGEQRSVELFVAPRGAIRYTLDDREPRDGAEYPGVPPRLGRDCRHGPA